MVDRIKLDSASLESETRDVLQSNLKKVKLSHSPTDIQEDIIREYMQLKDHGNVQSSYGDGKEADYNDFIDDRANNVTKSIISQIDSKGYQSWQKALETEVMKHYNNSRIGNVVRKLESEINKHLGSVDLSAELGSGAKKGKEVTISSGKTLGRVLKKIIKTVGAKSFWLADRLLDSGLNTARVFGTQMAFIAPFFLVFGSLFLGAVEGATAGLRCAGMMAAFTAGGLGLRVGAEAVAEKLGVHVRMI